MKKYTLLIVEDDEKTRKWEQVYFDRSEFSADFAANANEALEKLRAKHYDYAAVDVMLPVVSGLDLSAIINEEYPQTKVILCTAIIEFTAYKDYKGTIGLIEKPLYPFKISDIINPLPMTG
jgi:two-component system response regulator ResD